MSIDLKNISSFNPSDFSLFGTTGQATVREMIIGLESHPLSTIHDLYLTYNKTSRRFTLRNSAGITKETITQIFSSRTYESGWRPLVLDETDKENRLIRLEAFVDSRLQSLAENSLRTKSSIPVKSDSECQPLTKKVKVDDKVRVDDLVASCSSMHEKLLSGISPYKMGELYIKLKEVVDFLDSNKKKTSSKKTKDLNVYLRFNERIKIKLFEKTLNCINQHPKTLSLCDTLNEIFDLINNMGFPSISEEDNENRVPKEKIDFLKKRTANILKIIKSNFLTNFKCHSEEASYLIKLAKIIEENRRNQFITSNEDALNNLNFNDICFLFRKKILELEIPSSDNFLNVLSIDEKKDFLNISSNKFVDQTNLPGRNEKVLSLDYPPNWEELLPNLAKEEKEKLLDNSPLFQNLKMQLEKLKPPLSFSINWNKIREFILEYPTKSNPQAIDLINRLFYMGEDYWKLFIDHKYQIHGPTVFDRELHGNKATPGYLGNMQAATILLCYSFHEFSKAKEERTYDRVALYLALHKVALGDKEGERYRNKKIYAFMDHSIICDNVTKEEFEATTCNVGNTPISSPECSPHYQIKFWNCNTVVLACYLHKIFQCFEIWFTKAKNPEEHLVAIAAFHQALERFHLFLDGNSRTNILYMQGELVQRGYNPTIIDPNGSYFVSIREWTKQIWQGMELARKEYRTNRAKVWSALGSLNPPLVTGLSKTLSTLASTVRAFTSNNFFTSLKTEFF